MIQIISIAVLFVAGHLEMGILGLLGLEKFLLVIMPIQLLLSGKIVYILQSIIFSTPINVVFGELLSYS
jgi:hypothetical protein